MEHALILLSMGLLLNVSHKLDAELNVIPRDTEVTVNETTYMNCSTSLEAEKVHWHHGDKHVYKGTSILQPYDDRFSVEINSSTGTNNLVIRSVQTSDAGLYECLEDEGFGEQRSAQLIVLDDDPVCKSSMHSSGVIGPNNCGIEPDEVKLSCSITYHGNIFPILQWKPSGDNQPIKEGLSKFIYKNDATYTLTMNSTLDLNNSSFICQTTRTSNRNYGCSSDVIRILYVFSSKVTVNMTMNDEVSCFANTSQLCRYKWKWFSGDDSITVSDDQTLKPNRVGSHRCEVSCSMGNKSCTVEAMHAEVHSAVESEEVVRKREEELQRLFDTLPKKYKSDPALVHKITTKAAEQEKKGICGLTILAKELFTVSEFSSNVEVYDSTKWSFIGQWNLEELFCPLDIGSCNTNKCLYILDSKKSDRNSNEILRVDSNGKLINNWSTGYDCGCCLSVTYELNVILTVDRKNKLYEYSPDGQLIRELNLSHAGICRPWHAIKLTSGHFVVSDLHRVCEVDADGKLMKSCGNNYEATMGKMDCPVYLAVDGNGFVMVADSENSRVLLLDSDLEFKREILSVEKHRLQRPERIILDQTNSLLFVVDKEQHSEGRILICELRSEI